MVSTPDFFCTSSSSDSMGILSVLGWSRGEGGQVEEGGEGGYGGGVGGGHRINGGGPCGDSSNVVEASQRLSQWL